MHYIILRLQVRTTCKVFYLTWLSRSLAEPSNVTWMETEVFFAHSIVVNVKFNANFCVKLTKWIWNLKSFIHWFEITLSFGPHMRTRKLSVQWKLLCVSLFYSFYSIFGWKKREHLIGLFDRMYIYGPFTQDNLN